MSGVDVICAPSLSPRPCLPGWLQDAWRGRQSAATTLAHMDNFFKTVLTSSMGNDLQARGGAVAVGWQLFCPLEGVSSSCLSAHAWTGHGLDVLRACSTFLRPTLAPAEQGPGAAAALGPCPQAAGGQRHHRAHVV